MRILLVTQYYHPEPIPYVHASAQALRDLGHEVEVLTSFPCYPEGTTYSGYRQKLVAREQVDGIDVIRLPQLPDHSRSPLKRALYYLSFAFSLTLLGPLVVKRPDVILVYQAAMPGGFGALAIGLLRRAPVVLNVVDLWPESVLASGMGRSKIMLGMVRQAMKFLYGRATKICVITSGYRDNLIENGVPAEKISLIYYWRSQQAPNLEDQDRQLPRVTALNEKALTVMYAGNLGVCQHLETVIDAATELRHVAGIRFVFVGDGTDSTRLRDLVAARRLENVQFVGRQPPAALPALYAEADLLLVHLKPDEMSQVSIPSKTFDYIAHGKPILMAVQGEASRLAADHGFGIVVPPCDPEAMAAAVLGFARTSAAERRKLELAAEQAYRTKFCGAVQLAKLESVLVSCTSSGMPKKATNHLDDDANPTTRRAA